MKFFKKTDLKFSFRKQHTSVKNLYLFLEILCFRLISDKAKLTLV